MKIGSGALLLLVVLAACTVRVDPPFDALPRRDTGRDAGALPDLPPVDITLPDTTGLPDLGFPDVPGVPDSAPPLDVATDLSLPDGGATDVADLDAGPLPDLPSFRYCPWEVAALPRAVTSQVFLGESFLAADNLTSPMDGACDDSLFPDRTQPERVFLVQPQDELRMIVRTQCDGWDCDALVVSGDCTTSNVDACLTTDGDERYALDVLPLPHLVVVERRSPFTPGDFDLQIALNDTDGHEDCPVVETLSVTELEETGDCLIDGDERFRQVTIPADSSAGMIDHVYLGCEGDGIRKDATGGAPDAIWAFVADQPEETARLLSVTLRPEGDWESFLAVTAAPCGAVDAVIDCDQSLGDPIAIENVLLFPGDVVYVVVDGVGDRAFEGRHAGPFSLTVRVSVPSCLQ